MGSLTSALSGLQAAGVQLDVAANNVANADTAGFQPSQVALWSTPPGGVGTSVVPDQAPPTIPGLADEDQPSGTDLTEEMPNLLLASISYTANARVIDASSSAVASLVDVLA